RVLVNGYDSSGTQTGQVIAWGPNEIQPGDRVYFDVTVPAGAATYDVSIFSWKWKFPPSGGAGRHEEEAWGTRRAGSFDQIAWHGKPAAVSREDDPICEWCHGSIPHGMAGVQLSPRLLDGRVAAADMSQETKLDPNLLSGPGPVGGRRARPAG